MNVEEIKKYKNKKVLLILQNHKITCVLPEEITQTFSVVDKFGANVSIDCEVIKFIQEVPGGPQ